MASLMRRMLLNDSGFDVTKRIVRASGEVRYVRWVGTAVSDNAPSKIMGVGIDITEHEVLTQELKRREGYLPKRNASGILVVGSSSLPGPLSTGLMNFFACTALIRKETRPPLTS